MVTTRVPTNVFSMLDDDGEVCALGLFPGCAMLNHSCSPNAIQSFKGAQLEIVALRDIAAGEEVTISYGAESSKGVADRSQSTCRRMWSSGERR